MDKIKDYDLLDVIYETPQTRLYKAKKETEAELGEGLLYVVKEYQSDINNSGTRELVSSQRIDNASSINVVVPVLERIDDRYIVMQFKNHGIFLAEKMETAQKSGLVIKEICRIGIEILASLDVLHNCYRVFSDKKGYLHMDLHPGNIFLEDIGEGDFKVKFIDLQSSLELDENGIAYRTEGDYQFTEGYAAPERYNYKNEVFDESCDIYSVAKIIEELMDLAQDPNQVLQHLIENVISIGKESSPSYRFRTALEMKEVLDSILELLNDMEKNDYIGIADRAYRLDVDIDMLVQDIGSHISLNENNYKSFLEELSSMLLTDRPNQNKCLYLYEYLDALYRFSDDNEKSDSLTAKLLYLGIGCYNNTAYSKKAAELAETFFNMKEKGVIGISDYASTINRITETYYDMGDVDKAAKLQEENIGIEEQLYSTYINTAKTSGLAYEDESIVRFMGRSYSAYGRYLYVQSTYTQNEEDKKKGIDYLEKAVDVFQDRVNKHITISHILKTAIEKRDINLANKYIPLYLNNTYPEVTGVENLIESFIGNKEIIWEPRRDYDLLDILMLINAFCINDINETNIEAFAERLRGLMTQLSSREYISYPVNLIYKHMALIIYKLNDNEVNEDVLHLFKKAVTSNDSFVIDRNRQLSILMVMSYQIRWMECEMCGWEDEKKKLLEQFIEHSGDSELGLQGYYQKAAKYETLESVLRLT